MTGQPLSKIEEMCSPDIIKTDSVTYFLKPSGSETFPNLIKRGRKVLKEIYLLHKEGNILLVTHGDVVKMIYADYYKLNWRDVLRMFHFGNSDLLELSKNTKPENSHIIKTAQKNL